MPAYVYEKNDTFRQRYDYDYDYDYDYRGPR